MARAEQNPGENQFPVIDPKYFKDKFQETLYGLLVEEGENGVPAKAAKALYNVPEFALSTREYKFKKGLQHLRQILGEHYKHEIENRISPTRGMSGQQAHYVLKKIQRP